MLVNREELIAALGRLKPALSSGGVVQELSHVWFAKDCTYAYDGGFGIKLDYATELECGVPGVTLMELLGTSTLKDAKLELKGEVLSVGLGKSNSKLGAFKADRRIWNFPEKLPKGIKPLPLGEDFVEALRRTLLVKARPATRVEHHGVMLSPNKNTLELHGTDSATIAQALVQVAVPAGFSQVVLPRDFAEQIVSQSPEGVKLYVLEDCLIAEGDGITFYSNLLDVSGADDMGAIVDRQIDDQPKRLSLPPGLDAALSRAAILAGKEEPVVSISLKGGNFTVFGDYALGTLDESLKLEGKMPDAKLRIKAELLKRALPYVEHFSMNESCLILMGDPGFTYVMVSL